MKKQFVVTTVFKCRACGELYKEMRWTDSEAQFDRMMIRLESVGSITRQHQNCKMFEFPNQNVTGIMEFVAYFGEERKEV